MSQEEKKQNKTKLIKNTETIHSVYLVFGLKHSIYVIVGLLHIIYHRFAVTIFIPDKVPKLRYEIIPNIVRARTDMLGVPIKMSKVFSCGTLVYSRTR